MMRQLLNSNWFRVLTATLLCAGLQFTAAGIALAGPPYITDDPEPTDYQHFEIYSGSQFANGPSGPSATFPFGEVNYGLLPNVQFSVDLGLAEAHSVSLGWKRGMGDTGIGLKYRFLNETDHLPEISFYPSITLPTGNAANGLGSGAPSTFLPMWAQKTVGRYTLFGGGGLRLNPGADAKNSVFSGLAVVRQMTKRWALGGEAFHESAAALADPGLTGFSVGSTYTLDDVHSVLLSVGRSLNGTNRLTTYASYEWAFGLRRPKPGTPIAEDPSHGESANVVAGAVRPK